MSEKRAAVALVSGFGFSLAAGAGVVFGSVSIATNVAKFFVSRHKVRFDGIGSNPHWSLQLVSCPLRACRMQAANAVACAECRGEKFVLCTTCSGATKHPSVLNEASDVGQPS